MTLEQKKAAMTVIDDWTLYMTATSQAVTTIRLNLQVVSALTRHAGVASPEQLTRMHVVAFLARPIKPWSKLTYYKAIRSLTTYMREFGVVETDLLAGIPKPKAPDPVARPLDDDTVSRLLAARLSARPHAYVRLALFGGLRVHEIAKLRGEDLDLAAGWLYVTGKGGRTAPVPVHPEIAKLAEQMAEFGFWFPSPAHVGRPVSAIAVSQTIAGALRSVGSNATAHQLRDTAATRIQRQVKDIRVTQSMLRHRSIRSTQKYTGVADTDLQAAVQSLMWEQRAA